MGGTMLITIDKAVKSTIGFLSGEVGKVNDTKDRFIMFAALGAIQANPSGIINTYKPMLKSVGIVDDDDMVETESVRSALNLAFANVPKVSALGFTFNQSDADALLQRMED